MDLALGYDLPASSIERLHVLDWIYDQAGGRSNVTVAGERLTSPEGGYTAEAAVAVLGDLAQRGYISLSPEASVIGIHDPFLLPAGLDLVEQVRRHRGDRGVRRKAARDALLRWLHDRAVHGETDPVLSGVHRSGFGYLYGDPFTQQEIEAASRWLAENGFLRGRGSWGGGIPRPSITAKGESLVENDGSVNEQAPQHPPTNYVSVTGDNNTVTTDSPHARVQVSISQDAREHAVKVADAVDSAAGVLGLTPSDEQAARDLAAGLREEAGRPRPDAGRIRQILGGLQRVVVSGSGAALGEGIVALCQAALGAL